MKIDTIIFDLGGVLIDWNPRHLYRKIFDKEEEMEWFLGNVCTMEWNVEQDSGRTWEEAVDELLPQYPDYGDQIRAYNDRWTEMLAGPIEPTVETLKELKQSGEHRLLALTNWSAQKFPIALEKFEFLQLFEGILVSGEEKMRKPHAEIYQLLMERYNLDAGKSLFIDDSKDNVEAAHSQGMQIIHFQNHPQFKDSLEQLIS